MYKRFKFFYFFTAWIDSSGSNRDKLHAKVCESFPPLSSGCRHFWMIDMNTTKNSKMLWRFVKRNKPFYASFTVGKHSFKIGRRGCNTI